MLVNGKKNKKLKSKQRKEWEFTTKQLVSQ